MHPSLLPTLKLFFVFFSFVLYGVACAGLVTDELRGDLAMALVAFAGGVGCWVVVLMCVFFLFPPNLSFSLPRLLGSEADDDDIDDDNPSRMFTAHSKPDKWIATTWFDLATSSTLFVFLTGPSSPPTLRPPANPPRHEQLVSPSSPRTPPPSSRSAAPLPR